MILPDNYILEYPPFKLDDTGMPVRVNVTVSMELLAISDINEVGQTFTAQFSLSISWLDFRLELFNMKEDMHMNTLTAGERESIWFPKLVFSNTKEKELTKNDDASYSLAMRENDFEFSSMTSTDNIYMFKGSGNQLSTSRVYNVEWICVYQLAWYPFDTQTCRMILEADGNSEFVDLNVGAIEYSGPMDLTQYFVKSTSMIKADNGTLDVVMVLGRRLFGLPI